MVTVVEYLAAAIQGKPMDGSDVQDFEQARAELCRLRRVTYRVCDILGKSSGQTEAPSAGNDDDGVYRASVKKKKVHRQALAEDDLHKNYKKVTVSKPDGVRELLKGAITDNPLFKGCTVDNLNDFVDVFAPKKFSAGSTVIKQGDKGETFYVVETGALDIFVGVGTGTERTETQVGLPYGPGTGFGELALIYGSPRAVTIRASEECILWEITRTAFKGLKLKQEQQSHELKLTSLRGVKIGEKVMGDVLSTSELDSMALAVKNQSFAKGDVIIREGEKGDVFYVITKGSVVISKEGKQVGVTGVNTFIGEKALLSSDVRAATCVAETEVECLTLNRQDFVLLLGNLEDILAGKRKLVKDKSVWAAETTTYELNELEKKGVLGQGAFGKVSLVQSKADGKLYALKAQSKAHIVDNGQESHTVAEYQILHGLNHPCIVKIYQALQDKKYVYFLMDLLPGGELMDLLDSRRKFPESWSRFYGATVLTAFKYIHQKRIAYRDLKPENLVLDANGYCYLVDFGLAKICEKGKTWTFCGTPDYLAPEVLSGKGHDWGVDCWGLGIFLYEITHGFAPFYADDPTKTARNIIRGRFAIPSSFSESLSDLIRRLLVSQERRLGRIKGGAEEVKKHQWFSGFDWEALLKQQMKVPWKPKVGDLGSIGKIDHDDDSPPDSDWNPVFDIEDEY